MKLKVYFLLLLFMLLVYGCKSNISEPETDSKGNISLSIDKVNAPSDVVTVTAKLTRSNYSPISNQMNIQSDTSASIVFEAIAAGIWNLKIDALDSAGTIKYTGQSTVNVISNTTVSVSLVLQPVLNSSTGNVVITVTWASAGWKDYSGNPILKPASNNFDYAGVMQPKVLFENGIYKMWYTGLANGSYSTTFYAVSTNGINWEKHSLPVLSPSSNGWDEVASIAGAVLKEDNGYKMYYVGWNSPYSNWHIGLATSANGINWTKHSSPVLLGTQGMEFQVIPSAVFKINNIYYLFYNGRDESTTNYRVYLAISVDGINWEKVSQDPVLVANKIWEEGSIMHPSILYEDGIFKMVYGSRKGTAFGYAESTNGTDWIKDPSPFFIKSQTSNNWGIGQISYPFLIKTNNKLRIYYSAYSSGSIFKIGFMEK
jgi:predicted GH43/DUF377 family glycosyl hydrolase